MIRSITPLHISKLPQEKKASFKLNNRRHTKEELKMLEITWREIPPDHPEEHTNCYLKGQALPRINQNRIKKHSPKNFIKVNKSYVEKLSEEKLRRKPVNLNLSKIIVAIASSVKKNSTTSYKFQSISPDMTNFPIIKRRPYNKLK